MGLGLLFWVIMLLVIIGCFYLGYSDPPNRRFYGMSFVVFLLLFILGWRVFGFIVQDDGARVVDPPPRYVR